IASWAPNIVVKIPIITTLGAPCLGVISALTKSGVRVNATACLSFNQAMLAAKAGATYVSLFAGRISDEGADASQVIRGTADWLSMRRLPPRSTLCTIPEPVTVHGA